ncbi:MAG TPA: Do family serine endopeptidase [Acidiferrobacteraceae bacterium]|nr:Do family serine endopeptidase [Acidiferrobacteraceae bacterium]
MALGRKARFFLRTSITGVVAAAVLILVQPQLVAKQPPVVELVTAPNIPIGVNQGPVSYADAVQRAAPGVVNINTSKTVTLQIHPFYNDPFFRQFFGDMIQSPNQPRKRVENSLGSGVVVSANGYILTNHHVVRGADEINVFFRDGRSAQAKVIGTDEETDLAVLKVDLTDLPVITLADSQNTKVGDVVLAIGNPFGVGQTVTMGIVSATGRDQLGINTFENFIQTDAAINPGNSGGALVDAHGRLIGINTAIFSRSGGSQGIGFAIPTSMAKEVMEQIIKYGRPIRGWLGFEGQQITPKLARALGLKTDQDGVIITGVVRNSPAHKAGLIPGDLLVAIDGTTINRARQALIRISKHKPGDKVSLKVVRNGKTKTFIATAIDRPNVSKRRRFR